MAGYDFCHYRGQYITLQVLCPVAARAGYAVADVELCQKASTAYNRDLDAIRWLDACLGVSWPASFRATETSRSRMSYNIKSFTSKNC